jgi:hypothetical protein
MNTLSSISIIARFESKTLTRGWFFRIFSAIAILFIFFFNLVGFTNIGNGGWSGRLLPGSVPYINLFLLNLAQAVIAVFLSSDFLGRDKKLDTTEAFYVRSVSNFAYVMGKTLGVLKVFLFLNFIILCIGVVFNLIATDTAFFIVPYLLYPLLISLPTLLMVLGLSYFLMVLIRNQAVTFILMLGFIGASIFYLSGKLYNVFDFIGFNTPMTYSAFTGFPNIGQLFLVRGAYALIGIGFIALTILKLPRLPQERNFKTSMITGALITLVPATIMLSIFVGQNDNAAKLRSELLQIESQLPLQPGIQIESNQLDVTLNGDELTIQSNLQGVLTSEKRLLLALNPGFTISEIKVNGIKTGFTQNKQVIDIQTNSINSSLKANIKLTYKGKPIDAATFIDIPEEIRIEPNRIDPIVGGKQICYVTSNYVLMTREAGWYPVAACRDYRSQPQFSRFELKITVPPQLTTISSGNKKEEKPGCVIFDNPQPLNALAFTTGEYETKKVIANNIEISYSYKKGFNYVFKYFDLLNDTIPSLLSDMKGEFERRMGYSYPFKKFSIVEVPVHFFTYPRSYTLATEDNMPEMIFCAENGGGNFQNDLNQRQRWIKNDNDRNNQGLLPQDIQAQLFKNITGSFLLSPNGQRFGGGTHGTQLRTLIGWSKQSAFPQFFSYTNGISQSGFPIMQFITENYLFSSLQTSQRGGFGYGQDASSSDQVILKMKGKNLMQLLDSMKHDANLPDIISKKGTQFFNTVQMNIKPKEIETVLNDVIMKYRFKQMPVDTFINELTNGSGSNMKSAIDNWLHNATMPAFLFGKTEAFEVTEGDRVRYFIRTHVANTGNGDGVLSIGIREQQRNRGGGGGFGPRGGGPAPSVEETYELAKGEKVEIGLMADNEPRELTINTFISENIPANQRIGIDDISKSPVTTFTGLRNYNGTISYCEKYETIVDNEDEGFSTNNTGETKTIKDWWMGRNLEASKDKYQEIRFWDPSPRWQPIINASYFGKYIKSAVYKRKGDGNAVAQWLANLENSGNYSIYIYLPPQLFGRRRREERDGEKGTYHYTIYSDDGQTPIEVDPSEEQEGWAYIGDYYISQGEAKITINDLTTRYMVIADAVKWVLKK